MPETTCSIDDCDSPVNARGWCRRHYVRWQRHGDPLAMADNGHPHSWKRGSAWPPDDDLLALFVETGRTRQGLAAHLGCNTATLARYVKRRPELDARLDQAKPVPMDRSEYYRRYRARHPERVRAQRKAYAEEHRDQVAEWNRKWHQNNRAAVRVRKRREKAANPERVRENQRRSIERNRAAVRVRVQLQYHRRKGGPEAAEYGKVLLGDPCCYCGEPMKDIDHIVPLSKGGSGEWHNLTAACAFCNRSKQAQSLLGFMLSRLEDADLEAAS